jgi:hypothetical protein
MKKSDISRYFAKVGSKGGKISSAAMTKKQRIERARKAGLARAAKAAAKKKGGRK